MAAWIYHMQGEFLNTILSTILILILVSCAPKKSNDEQTARSCTIAGAETTYRFEEGVQRAQMYNCTDVNHKICTLIVSLETGSEIYNCNIPPWGQ